MTEEQGRKTLTQRRKEETRENIIAAATRIFAAKGYDAATTDEIAESCAISKGALYHHFPSKDELFKALLRSRFHDPVRVMLATRGGESVLDLEATVRASVEAAWRHALTDEMGERLWQEARTQAERNPEIRALLQEVHDRSEGAVIATLVEGQRSGIVRQDLDLKATAAVVGSMVDGSIAHYLAHPDAFEVDRVIEATVDAIVRFLRP